MLNRKQPFGEVFGEGAAGARWYQDGHYYAPDGRYLFSNPGIAPPPGQTLRTMEEAEAAAQAELEAQSAPPHAVAPPQSKQVKAKASKPAAAPTAPPSTDLPLDLTREQKLAQMAYFQLASLIKAAGGEPIQGAGAKAKMIAWLLANTSE